MRHLSAWSYISIHALRVEGDRAPVPALTTFPQFLSTPSGWRATTSPSGLNTSRLFLSTPSGWRATFKQYFCITTAWSFLSTPSGWRATMTGIPSARSLPLFLSTPSGWRATQRVHTAIRSRPPISIHALRVEGDLPRGCPPEKCDKFLSTPSGWRATQITFPLTQILILFLSTPSGWRATGVRSGTTFANTFLSTPSGWRATRMSCSTGTYSTRFLSTPSGWRATVWLYWDNGRNAHFYPRPPGGGRLTTGSEPEEAVAISIHALRVEGDDKGAV